MSTVFGSMLDDDGWVPMNLDGQNNPRYYWHDGRMLADAPGDFRATFDGGMFSTRTKIDVQKFNRNPLRVIPNFVVPRHHHNIDETILVFQGQYSIEYGEDPQNQQTVVVKPGMFFTSRAGTPYTMTAGPEGVTYIETWGVPVRNLKTVWHDFGWKYREGF